MAPDAKIYLNKLLRKTVGVCLGHRHSEDKNKMKKKERNREISKERKNKEKCHVAQSEPLRHAGVSGNPFQSSCGSDVRKILSPWTAAPRPLEER